MHAPLKQFSPSVHSAPASPLQVTVTGSQKYLSVPLQHSSPTPLPSEPQTSSLKQHPPMAGTNVSSSPQITVRHCAPLHTCVSKSQHRPSAWPVGQPRSAKGRTAEKLPGPVGTLTPPRQFVEPHCLRHSPSMQVAGIWQIASPLPPHPGGSAQGGFPPASSRHTWRRPQQLLPQRKCRGHRSFPIPNMIVVVVVVSVVEVVAIVVVVLAGPATSSATQFSARPCTVSEVLVL